MTYDPALGTARDRIRLMLGDIDDANPLRPDLTYDALLADKGEAYTIAFLAQTFRTEHALDVDQFAQAGGISVQWRARDANWRDLIARYGWALDQDVLAAGAVVSGVVTYEGDPFAALDEVEDEA